METILILLNAGIGTILTYAMMEKAGWLSEDAGWIKWIDSNLLPAKLVRRYISYILPVLITAPFVAAGVWLKAIEPLADFGQWLDTCVRYSGLTILSSQSVNAIVDGVRENREEAEFLIEEEE